MFCPSNKIPASGYMKISCSCVVNETHSPLSFTHYDNWLQGECMSFCISAYTGMKETTEPWPWIGHAILLIPISFIIYAPILPHITRWLFTIFVHVHHAVSSMSINYTLYLCISHIPMYLYYTSFHMFFFKTIPGLRDSPSKMQF